MLLPIALDVRGRACLVVGGGAVAARKVASLVECAAEVTIITPQLSAALVALSEKSACKYLQRVFAAGDTSGFALVFACTDNRVVNAQIAHEAQAHGAWCNIADDAASSDFHNMATLRRDEICIGVSTTGGSPVLSRHLKAEIEKVIGPEYAQILAWMSEMREQMKARGAQIERAQLWRAVLASDVLRLLRVGDEEQARREFEMLMNAEM